MADLFKDLYARLHDQGLLDYGSTFKGSDVREILGITCPEVGTRKQFAEAALQELGAIDYIRNILLGRGRYLTSIGEDYRVLLPSENQRQVEAYMKSADRKLSRALKLSRNTPREAGVPHDQTEARILMKRHGIRGKTDRKSASNDGAPAAA